MAVTDLSALLDTVNNALNEGGLLKGSTLAGPSFLGIPAATCARQGAVQTDKKQGTMLVNIVGNFSFEQRGKALFIGTEESAAMVCDGQAQLVPPEPAYLLFSVPGVTAHAPYGDGPITVRHAGGQWDNADWLIGGAPDYGVSRTRNSEGDFVRIVHGWDGKPLATLPNSTGPRHIGPTAMVFTDSKSAHVYSPQGEVVASFTLQGHGVGVQPLAHFTDRLAFLRTDGDGPAYQMFDLQRLEANGPLAVAGAIFGVRSLPDGSTLVVDAEGIHRLGRDGGSGEPPYLLHRFEAALDTERAKLLLWHDPQHAYVAIDHDRDHQTLLAVPLAGNGARVQELRWSDTWAITLHGGFLAGQNYLSLKRKALLADNALLLWATGQALSPALLQADASPVVEVAQVPSATKGKHGYRLRIEDTCNNRAVRSAALELGRLLGEACFGPYQQTDEVLDRKFDGHFHMEIATSREPTDFERGFLLAYVGYFRDAGHLSPAGSKARLAPPAVTWTVGSTP